jgi:acyl homoserine lactone synthase
MGFEILIHEPMNPLPRDVMAEMFRLRHRVFRERLDWDVGGLHGLERDCYDLMSPVYGVAIGESGAVEGCWRLMPTTGPYLLKDVFPQLLEASPAPNHPQVWEASRFAVWAEDGETTSLGEIGLVTAALIGAMLETGLAYGLQKIVAVSDLRFERILARSGLATLRFGSPQRVGKTRAVSGWFDVTQDNLMNVWRTNHLPAAEGWPADLTRAA